ncbi:MAG: hypothetical protein ACXABV_13725, partial [Candidatus Thorarchaeota archaeon]
TVLEMLYPLGISDADVYGTRLQDGKAVARKMLSEPPIRGRTPTVAPHLAATSNLSLLEIQYC